MCSVFVNVPAKAATTVLNTVDFTSNQQRHAHSVDRIASPLFADIWPWLIRHISARAIASVVRVHVCHTIWCIEFVDVVRRTFAAGRWWYIVLHVKMWAWNWHIASRTHLFLAFQNGINTRSLPFKTIYTICYIAHDQKNVRAVWRSHYRTTTRRSAFRINI